MKKVLSLLFAMLVLCSIFTVPFSAQAATKDDLIAAIKATKLSKYLTVAAENSIRLLNFTPEQGDKLVAIVKDVDNIVDADRGPSAHTYPVQQRDAVTEKLSEACAVLNFTWKWKFSTNPQHECDAVFYIYDNNGKLVGTFDGDLWFDENENWVPGKDYRPGAETAYAGLWDLNMLFIGGGVLLLAAIAFVVFRKTRKSVEA